MSACLGMRRAGLGLVVACACSLFAAASAGAYVGNVDYDSSRGRLSQPDGGGFGLSLFGCGPEDGEVIGGQSFIDPHPKPVGFNLLGVMKFGDSNQVFGSGVLSTRKQSDSWTNRMRPYCADVDLPPPGDAGNAGYVKGIELVVAKSEWTTDNHRSIRARCPAGKQPIGGGIDVDGPGGIVLEAILRDGRDWIARAHEARSTAENWRVESTAVCANLSTATTASEYVDQVELVEAVSPSGSDTVQSAAATCPQGKNVIGGGGNTFTQADNEILPVMLTSNQPEDQQSTATTWVAEGQEISPVEENWTVTAFALCAVIDAPANPTP